VHLEGAIVSTEFFFGIVKNQTAALNKSLLLDSSVRHLAMKSQIGLLLAIALLVVAPAPAAEQNVQTKC
jgi:hypothetical protein